MLLSSASGEDAVFPKPCYHQELENATFPSRSELSEEPLCLETILFYTILKPVTTAYLQCLSSPPFLCYSWPCALHHCIKHYQAVNSPREATTAQIPENPDAISWYGKLPSRGLVHWIQRPTYQVQDLRALLIIILKIPPLFLKVQG